MKYIILTISIIVAGIFVYQNLKVVTPKVISDKIAETPTAVPVKTITFNEVTRGYSLVNNINPSKLRLVPNFGSRIPSRKLMADNNCTYGINGGFYDDKNRPIGLFRYSGKDISPLKKSQIFNGIISLVNGKLNIGDKALTDAQTWLQTGPILISEQKTEGLEIANDKSARRMVFAKNISGNAMFISIFDPETEKSGPFLSEMPGILQKISLKENLGISNAVNLDGGRASAFYGEDKILPETDTVGSWWCVTK